MNNEIKRESETYLIHDNGGRPFKIEDVYSHNLVKIYKENGEDCSLTYTHEIDVPYRRIFIGKSLKNKTTSYSGAYGPSFNGNNILLKIRKNYYLFIGSKRISYFSSKSEITHFNSPVGIFDVPYPYATDVMGNIYLLRKNVILLRNERLINNIKKYEDPYDYYYNKLHLMCPNRGVIPNSQPLVNTGIENLIIKNRLYTMTYNPFPKKEYERFLTFDEEDNKDNKDNKEDYDPNDCCSDNYKYPKQYPDEHIPGSILAFIKDGERIELSVDDYEELMVDFAKKIHVEPLYLKDMMTI